LKRANPIWPQGQPLGQPQVQDWGRFLHVVVALWWVERDGLGFGVGWDVYWDFGVGARCWGWEPLRGRGARFIGERVLWSVGGRKALSGRASGLVVLAGIRG